MGSKQQDSRVDAKASADEAVDGSVVVVWAQQGQHTAVEAVGNLGQVEAIA